MTKVLAALTTVLIAVVAALTVTVIHLGHRVDDLDATSTATVPTDITSLQRDLGKLRTKIRTVTNPTEGPSYGEVIAVVDGLIGDIETIRDDFSKLQAACLALTITLPLGTEPNCYLTLPASPMGR